MCPAPQEHRVSSLTLPVETQAGFRPQGWAGPGWQAWGCGGERLGRPTCFRCSDIPAYRPEALPDLRLLLLQVLPQGTAPPPPPPNTCLPLPGVVQALPLPPPGSRAARLPGILLFPWMTYMTPPLLEPSLQRLGWLLLRCPGWLSGSPSSVVHPLIQAHAVAVPSGPVPPLSRLQDVPLPKRLSRPPSPS